MKKRIKFRGVPSRKVIRMLRRAKHLRKRKDKRRRRTCKLQKRRITPPAKNRKLKLIRKQRRTRYERAPAVIACPADFDLVGRSTETIAFFRKLREDILINPKKRVRLDHQTIKQISPDAGIVLIAELFRADAYAPKCNKEGNLPSNDEVSELLEKIGYWQYFGVRFTGQLKSKRQFMLHKTGNRTDGKVIRDMIVMFREAVKLTKSEETRLYIALVECLDNVMNHAYPYARVYSPPRLRHQWWLLAYRDSETREVCFCFYDQGVGIPSTIRGTAAAQLELIPESDGEIVIRAVTQGSYSRHRRLNRGTGLPSLFQFVDEASAGDLIIITDRTKCIFPHGSVAYSEELAQSLDGTLILWRLKK